MQSTATVTHLNQLLRHTMRLIESASTQGTRSLLFINNVSGQELEKFSGLIGSAFIPATSPSDRSDRISALLGSERRSACIQFAQQPDLGLLAALAGTIHIGGLLVVGINIQQKLYDIGDADSDVSSSEQASLFSNHSRSTERFIRLVANAAADRPDNVQCVSLADTLLMDEGSKLSDLPFFSCITFPHTIDRKQLSHNPDAVAEQDNLYEQACNHCNTYKSSCVVIRGLRGRGKSHLLARLASHFKNTGVAFSITARHKSALQEFSRSFPSAIDHYLSPEAATGSSVQTLLVDEAANLSISQLTTYLKIYSQVVLCTTSEGYENAGRAIDVQLLQQWGNSSKHLLELAPRHPWRWKAGDPLEQFIDSLCLYKRDNYRLPGDRTPRLATSTATQSQHFSVRKIDTEELAHDETLLRNIVELLFATHYQSTTKDITHLLDAPSLELWIQEHDKAVAGVLWMEREGEIPSALHEPIVSKQRRLPNQLLPQLLAQTANDGRALSKQYIRVVRLAVASQFRRQGLASRLLEEVTHSSQGSMNGIAAMTADAIGASFSSDKGSRSFWQHHGYKEFHHGFRTNPRTGQRAIACLRAFDTCCQMVLDEALHITQNNIKNRAARTTISPTCDPLDNVDVNILWRYANGQRSDYDTAAALQKLLAMSPLPEKSKTDKGRARSKTLREHTLKVLKNL